MGRRQPGFTPGNRQFPFSRTALDDHRKCPRCFYQARRLGRKRPGIPPMTLNLAVDAILKREFDAYRERQLPHPVMATLPGDLVPFAHDSMDDWRNNFRGVRQMHPASGFELYGAPDDIWLARATGQLHVVDYKSTASTDPATLDTEYREAWKHQVEVYQYLLRGNGFDVSATAYFLFQNADKTATELGGGLAMTAEVVAYEGVTDWIDEALVAARACLDADTVPAAADGCELCTWSLAAVGD